MDDLTPIERAAVGEPGDLVDEPEVPARSKSASAMFSLRIDRGTFERLNDLAEKDGRRFSDIARDALRKYVAERQVTDSATLESISRKLDALAVTVGMRGDAPDVDMATRSTSRISVGVRRLERTYRASIYDTD